MTYHSGNQLIDPHFLFEKIGLAPGMHIADFGSGRTGNFVFPAAKIVGDTGGVYAVDIIKESLSGLAKRAASDNLLNVHTVWADIERPKAVAIPEKTLDAVLLINFLSAVKKNDIVLAEASRLTKTGGILLLVDWRNSGLSFSPPSEDLVDWNAVKHWAAANQCSVEGVFAVSKYHGGMILRKNGI